MVDGDSCGPYGKRLSLSVMSATQNQCFTRWLSSARCCFPRRTKFKCGDETIQGKRSDWEQRRAREAGRAPQVSLRFRILRPLTSTSLAVSVSEYADQDSSS